MKNEYNGKGYKAVLADYYAYCRKYKDHAYKNNNFINKIKSIIGECIENNECSHCAGPINKKEIERLDIKTKREYYVSGMCPACIKLAEQEEADEALDTKEVH
jgi:hypothetical protein